MSMHFYDAAEVSSGIYGVILTDVQELAQKWKFTMQPFLEDTVFEDIFYWADNDCSKNSLTYQLFSILGNRKDDITVGEFRSKYLKKKVGVIISDNTGNNGTLYHNIIQFFDIADWDDILSEYEGEEFDEEENDSDEEESEELEEDEESEDDDDDEEEDDDDEEKDEIPIRSTSSNGFGGCKFKRSKRR